MILASGLLMAKKQGVPLRGRGKDLGQTIDDAGARVGEKLRRAAKRVSAGIERARTEWRRERREKPVETGRKRHWEAVWEDWWFNAFGLIGPLLGSAFALLWLAIAIWMINFVNTGLEIHLLFAISSFLYANLVLFFAVSLFFGYARYFSKASPKTHFLTWPLTTAFAVAFTLWIAAWVVDLLDAYYPAASLSGASAFLHSSTYSVFIVLLALFYALSIGKELLIALARR